MESTIINIRTDKKTKKEAEEIYSKLGLNMSSAINLFLRASIREKGIPFSLILDEPNDITKKSIQEGELMLEDKNTKYYNNIDDLKKALDE